MEVTPTRVVHATEISEMSLQDAILYAVGLHQHMRLDAAETLYRRILEQVPDQPDTLHFLGVLEHQRGRSAEGVVLIERACSLMPDHPDSLINLGNVLAESGRLDEAVQIYERVVRLLPEHAGLRNNLGVVQKVLGNFEAAEAAYRSAIELDPEGTNAYNNLGLLFAAQGNIKEAIYYYCLSIAKMPGNPNSRRLLGIAYYTQGKIREAAEVFRQWLEEDPDHPVARHMYAACSGDGVPDRAPDRYVEHTFDHFAESFDKQLQENLLYRAPELCAEALERSLPASASSNLDVLDAGCGTGLCGPLLRARARALVGVDLSGGMLAKAQARACYDELVKAELTAFIASRPLAFDVIVSADTLVYFGPLESVLAACSTSLRPGGTLVFSVECIDEQEAPEGYRINPHGRYAHTRSYIEASLREAGLVACEIAAADLRMEGGEAVRGWVVAARLP